MADQTKDSQKQSLATRQTGKPDSGVPASVEPQLKKLRSSFDKQADTVEKLSPDAKPEKPKTTFKALGNVVLAMKRFQASLNPTYTYGKPTSASATTSSSHGGLDTSGSAQYSFPDRGHRADLLLRRLPDLEDEVGSNPKGSK